MPSKNGSRSGKVLRKRSGTTHKHRSIRENYSYFCRCFANIHDLVLKTMIAAEGEITLKMHANANFKTNCFELFGCDVILDK